MISIDQISEKLLELKIAELAKQTNFTLRKGGKISALSFIQSFFIMFQTGTNTLKAWAEAISMLIDDTVSDVAVQGKLQFRQLPFFEQLLAKVIQTQITNTESNYLVKNHLGSFNRVFLEDSTCISLPLSLFEWFKGAHSKGKKGKAATARIQLTTDLKSETTTKVAIQSFRDNDQKYSPQILSSLQAQDLLIRDQGYWALNVFDKIIKMGAYFLSRYRARTNIYEPAKAGQTAQQIDLLTLVKKADKQGISKIDKQVLVGAKQKVPMRLVMVKAPKKVADERRRKAKQNRNKRLNHCPAYLELLAWTIFVTNVASEVWQAKQILQVYAYRWRIETIFKCWKTHFNFAALFANKPSMTLPRVQITLYLLLTWIVLFFNQFYNYFERAILEQKNEFISLLKFAGFIKRWFTQLINDDQVEKYIERVYYYCRYDKRKNRNNFAQVIYYKNLA